MANLITRRAALVGLGGGLVCASQASALPRRRAPGHAEPGGLKNSDFYGADDKFNVEAAKDAYLAMLKRFGRPFSDELRKTMFVADFGLGHFLEVGLGGNLWVNDKKWNYTSLEMFLLPNQMVPEHWHVALPDESVPAKMESWHVRYGSTYTYGEGSATEKPGVKIHAVEKPFVTVMHEKRLGMGEVTGITKPGEKHWQQAGPEGAIITETSTFHTGAAVRFTNPKIKF